MVGSIISGFLLILCFPKFDISPFAFFAFVPLLFALQKIKGNFKFSLVRSFVYGFLTGFIFFSGILIWVVSMKRIGTMGIPAWILLSAFEAIYFGIFGIGVFFSNYLSNREKLLFLPSLFVILEYLRCKGFLGFPWGIIGYSQYRNIYFTQISEFTGVYGISFLIILFNTFLIVKEKKLKETLSVIFVFILIFLYGIFIISKPLPKENIKVALIQGNTPRDVEWTPEFINWTFNEYERLSLIAKNDAQIIVWPERVIAADSLSNIYILNKFKEISREIKGILVVGCGDSNIKGEDFNTVAVFHNGELLGKYYKMQLVPFGEVVPFKDFFQKINYNPWENWTDVSPGKDFAVAKTPFLNLGFNICYETAFSYISRNFINKGADVIIGVVADSWFGEIESLQHTAMFTLRAIENRCYLLRCADIGISCVIDPYGRIKNSLPLSTQGVVKGSISCNLRKTFYTKYGDVFIFLCFLLNIYLTFKIFYSIYYFNKKG